MDSRLPNYNNLSLFVDSELDTAYADLQNYIFSTGGVPLRHPLSSPAGNAPPPAAQYHHNPLRDIPPEQNVPNPWLQHFGDPHQEFDTGPHAFPVRGFNHGQLPQVLQTSDVAGAHPAQPVLELLATDSALNAGRAASQTKVADNKGTPKGQGGATPGKRTQGRSVKKDTVKAPAATPTPKARGKGSKAGVANHREPGVSDDEIDGLGDEAKENVALVKTGLTDEEKLSVVEYVTDEGRWPSLKVKQNTYFNELVKVLGKRVTQSQITNFWHGQAWAKYKACRDSLIKHTSGGDPDDPGLMSESDAEPDLPNLPASVQGRVFFKRKLDGDFSHATLCKFLHGKLYAMIHKRAHADSSIMCKCAQDSASVISDDKFSLPFVRCKWTKRSNSEDSDGESPLYDTLAFMKKRTKAQETTALAQLDIATHRDKREQREFEAQQDLQTWELILKKCKIYLDMVQSGDPQLVEMGKRKLLALE